MKKQLNIKIPENVSVNISPNNIEIKGKLGQLSLNKKEQFNCELDIQKNILVCSFIKDTYLIKKQLSYLTKQYVQFITNLRTNLKGVSNGFFIELKLVGVGYRFLSYKENVLVMKVGFCNNISFKVPEEITIFLESPTQITLFSIDYLLVKQTAASLRSFRRPDAYKGKGFQYLSEVLVLKEVKKNG
tara:strand:+ start:830 stop:1390 length:561 start_codon:yes stop_codon:yes gene_type:complete